jgi:hypothetical protein
MISGEAAYRFNSIDESVYIMMCPKADVPESGES